MMASPSRTNLITREITKRVESLDWTAIRHELDTYGAAAIGPVLTPDQADELIGRYDDDAMYRSRVVMERHGYGRGEYKYFDDPLPPMISALRQALYSRLATIANQWNEAMQIDVHFPATLDAFLDRCHAAGQLKPTPLILKYDAGDFNCLHQDLYGEHVFPLQVAFLLSAPGKDFTGGEFTLTEQRPRMQSRVEVVSLTKGMGVIFPVRQRPVNGSKGIYRLNMRHGVSRVRTGRRFTMGVIFHDAK